MPNQVSTACCSHLRGDSKDCNQASEDELWPCLQCAGPFNDCSSGVEVHLKVSQEGLFNGRSIKSRAYIVTAPIVRVPNEGTLDAEKHLEAHFDKLLERGGVKVTPLVGFRLLSHPLSHLGVLQTPAY
jgi:hypothetical protein